MMKNDVYIIEKAVQHSWSKIAPSWPLKNLIAVNPMAGFEYLPFAEALQKAQVYFQQKDFPEQMQNVNRESIKWLQVFFDEAQATIKMPLRDKGLLKSVLALLPFDDRLVRTAAQQEWLRKLPAQATAMIAECLIYLAISPHEQEKFLTLMLTTLPGWAAYIQYRTHWADATDLYHPHPVTQEEYLAFRLILTCLLWPQAQELFIWYRKSCEQANTEKLYTHMQHAENEYRKKLLASLSPPLALPTKEPSQAQLVFCIDVRSEPFRRALEAQGNYETYGFAGFFGVPVTIENAVTKESYASCPVLLKPSYKIVENPTSSSADCQQGYQRLQMFKKLYQSVKYNFITPFALVETLGMADGLWMAIRSFSPHLAYKMKTKLKNILQPDYKMSPCIAVIPLAQQVSYASSGLRMMGLTRDFAPLVIFCGHGSTTQNNAYATALDCGACGGRHGASNARILADILNQPQVREALQQQAIVIPETTWFLAAEHNTTTDAVEIYDQFAPEFTQAKIVALKKDLASAQTKNSHWRLLQLDVNITEQDAAPHSVKRAEDWAQVRPEWGLARNAAFIVGPRALTQNINLDGRSFLHSYDWQQDNDQSSLTTILTAPMVVAQWINNQYLFSTLDNVAFGGGSKITKNITGKIAIMQGNASDLMPGLPLQSVYKSDTQAYHEPLRLTVIVYAPRSHIEPIINQQLILQKLFGNGWVQLVCLEPHNHLFYLFERNMTWTQYH